ncbi:hypothetical protein [Streptosporangium pseudovulgare]|uniref:Uncharacterized protein n=1 Tax=Streptosporangium pseudovulgare TaxID=35765 RepID=A0ABQ2R7U1_9ACTN|nr:hypothetical protein [Streptosporangium pseudovulgare]GGQ17085.1 hypothetical protein GCM10010140_54060 [Streptosporangium pseudovulgare]
MAARSAGPAAVAMAALLTVTLLGGCGGDRRPAAAPPEVPVVATSTAAAPPPHTGPDLAYDGECPTGANARPLAKTRFALHAGLALGAFYRYIYRPLRSGGFKAGAEKRKRTFAKAAVAGLFTLHELKVARGFALANPGLCRSVKAVSDRFDALTAKLRNGTATEADVAAGRQAFGQLQQGAAQNGYGFKEKNVTVPGAS